MPVPEDAVDGPEALIQSARSHYASKQYRQALEGFTRAMRQCPCSRKRKRERCVCKDFERTVSNGESLFKEAMYTCKCSVGKDFSKCDRAAHIQALDYRAATFEAMGELGRARRDAEWILELAPRLADGYLRLGKIARLQGKHEFAWNVYNAGIEVTASSSVSKSRKVDQLYAARQPLQQRFSRRDPFDLPLEIALIILSLFDLVDLIRCTRVSKAWRNKLGSPANMRLWRNLVFPNDYMRRPTHGSKRPLAPRIESMKALLRMSGNDVRSLTFPNASHSQLTTKKFLALMQGAMNLEQLHVHDPYEPLDLPRDDRLCTKLTDLSLSGFDGTQGCAFPYSIVQNAAKSLQRVDIYGIPYFESIPEMTSLKCLRLKDSRDPCPGILLSHLIKLTPNLEQFSLENVPLRPEGHDDGEFWPNLKALSLYGPVKNLLGARGQPRGFGRLFTYRYAKTLRYLDIGSESLSLAGAPDGRELLSIAANPNGYSLSDLGCEIPQHLSSDGIFDFANLEQFHGDQYTVHPKTASAILKNTIDSGFLRSMSIVFPIETAGTNEEEGGLSYRWADSYSWLRGNESITFLTVSLFHFGPFSRRFPETCLFDLIAGLPSLETLEIHSMSYDETGFCSFLARLLQHTEWKALKVVHQMQVTGIRGDNLDALAKKHGIELKYGLMPRSWPVTFRH